MLNNVEKRSSKGYRKKTFSTGEKAHRNRRERRIEIRMGEDELSCLDAQCSARHITRSEYLRDAVMNPKQKVIYRQPRYSAEVNKLVDKTNRIGVNMNQLARAMNKISNTPMSNISMAMRVMPQREEIQNLKESVDSLTEEVKSLRNAYEHELLEREDWIDKFRDAFDAYQEDTGCTYGRILDMYGGER